MSIPGVQNPHCIASLSTKHFWSTLPISSSLSPSTVRILAFCICPARTKQLVTASLFSTTVHAPHSPDATALLGAGQSEVFPENINHTASRLRLDGVLFPVEAERKMIIIHPDYPLVYHTKYEHTRMRKPAVCTL